MNLRTTVVTAGSLLLMLGSLEVQAVPTLRLTSSAGGSVTIADGSAGDAYGANGVVSYNGSLAGWDINITTGFTKPVLGTADSPLMDLASANLSGGAGTLTIEFTDTDFTLPGLTNAGAAIGGTTDGSISYATFYDGGNTAFGTAGALTSLTGLGSGAFSSTAVTEFLAPTLYSLTMVVEITHGSGLYNISSFDATLRVPEPGTLALFGIGLAALGLIASRKRRTRTALRTDTSPGSD